MSLVDRLQKQTKNVLENLKSKDLSNPKFVNFSKNNRTISKLFIEKIDKFYDQDFRKEIESLKLPNNLYKEVYLYEWTKINGYNAFKQNYVKIENFLYDINSGFFNTLPIYRKKLINHSLEPRYIFNDFIINWERYLFKKIFDYRLILIEEKRLKFSQELYNSIEMVKKSEKSLKTVWNFFGKIVDFNFEAKKGINLKVIEKFSQILEKNPSINEVAKLLGRLKGESNLLEQNLSEKIVIKTEQQPIGNNPEEIVGVTESKDLEHMLPFELVYLSTPQLKPIFYKKYVESKLNTFEFISLDDVPVEEKEIIKTEKPVPKDRGPIVICLDTSASMMGGAEQIAKALTLAVSKIAFRENRKCYMINFSQTIETYNFSDIANSLEKLTKFLAKSFNSDTNFDIALEHALTIMDTKDYFNADVLLISDFLNTDISERLINNIKVLKTRRNRFNALCIGNDYNIKFQEIFDNFWKYNPRDTNANEKLILELTDNIAKRYNNFKEAKDYMNDRRNENVN